MSMSDSRCELTESYDNQKIINTNDKYPNSKMSSGYFLHLGIGIQQKEK